MIQPISYLEAFHCLKSNELKKLKKKKISLLSSSSLIQLDIFIRGIYSKIGFDVSLETLDFGTFKQFLSMHGFDSRLGRGFFCVSIVD